MNKLRRIYRACAATAAFLFLSQASWAGKEGGIDIHVGSGNVLGILEEETHLHLDAFRRVVLTRPAFHSNTFLMNGLQKRLWDSTVARFDYSYKNASGETVTRTYHARSGQSIGGTMDDIAHGGSSSGSSSSGSGKTPTANDLDILKDAEERRFYTADNAEHVRVRNLDARGSKVKVTNGDFKRVRDAELKTLRHIEFDLRNGVIPEGGRITGYVSQPPCDSCTEVIRNFGEDYEIAGDIYHLVPAPRNAAPADGELGESNKAASRYFRVRKRAIEFALQANRVTTPAPATWGADASETIGALQAAEQGELNALPCRK
ncbi:hypothetical protein [Luteibacter yeojuensis]|uniref:Deaminase of polymorphic toxin system n=1 Tax=Luteibacter yeojuensis TaxID=345309 RepID=A0A7X5QVG3_9GAMM|nr:hypothetical protein [Luteibacter yeojuensis]NID16148.1 hypothetical protein [Luteibacter yeojuensis]